MEDLADTLISGISDDLCRRLTNSTMVMQGQMANLANGNKQREEVAEIKGAATERERCIGILTQKYGWQKRRATNAFKVKDNE